MEDRASFSFLKNLCLDSFWHPCLKCDCIASLGLPSDLINRRFECTTAWPLLGVNNFRSCFSGNFLYKSWQKIREWPSIFWEGDGGKIICLSIIVSANEQAVISKVTSEFRAGPAYKIDLGLYCDFRSLILYFSMTIGRPWKKESK